MGLEPFVWGADVSGRKTVERFVIVVEGQADLFEVVDAEDRRAASRADCTAGSNSAISADDGDDDEELD